MQSQHLLHSCFPSAADPLGADLAERTAQHLPEAVITYSLANRDAAVFAEKVKVRQGVVVL